MTEPIRVPEAVPASFRYEPTPSAFDETFLSDGRPRPHLADFWSALEALPGGELSKRAEQGERLIRENGVTYNVYGDPRGMDRPWLLDAIPLVLDPDDWRRVARGLEQRARLLNAILADLYGPQHLLRDGLLPAELVLQNPRFLRPLHGFVPRFGTHLHLYAADLARSPDGRFWVLGDRAQAPSGAGYALENRIVISRLFPQLFRECRVERLAHFFSNVRDALAQLAPTAREQPRVVLLTPGAHNETYFEHAYLARYLGYTLVEGADLTVRNQRVYLKTLGGLERVDVILRRMDDSYTDPLSLRSDSSLGVAGLVQATRKGHVAIANALGSGLVESAALLAFMPELCRRLLAEELMLPSVPSWWCGREDSCRYVLSQLETLVIKPAFSGQPHFEAVFAGALSSKERAELARRIETKPSAYVAEEQIELSTAPVWAGDSIQPRHVSLRAFVANLHDVYSVMPGGLARVSPSRASLVVSMQRGGGSKDCWIVSSALPSSLSLLKPPGGRVDIVRSGGDLASRVADDLFWLGRYMERAESMTRLLRSIISRLTEEANGERGPRLNVLLQGLETSAELAAGLLTSSDGRRLERRLFELLISPSSARSLRSAVESAFRAGSVARDRISSDTWRVLSLVQDVVMRFELQQRLELQDTLEILNRLILWFSAFNGLSGENMVHGPGWRFADMGRRIERAWNTARLARSMLVESADAALAYEALLDVIDSSLTYRSRYRGLLACEAVLDLVLTDETNPRSVAFQLVMLDKHVQQLPRNEQRALLAPLARTALRALAAVRLADLEVLAQVDDRGSHERLRELLLGLETDLPLFADQLTLSYLAHAEASVSLGS